MKINTTTKKVIDIELSMTDVRNGLKNYQLDQLHDLASNLKCSTPFQQYELFWNLMQGEDTKWFNDIIEANSIYWIRTPKHMSVWAELIEQFPNIFIHDASNVLKDCAADALSITFEDYEVDSVKVLSNI